MKDYKFNFIIILITSLLIIILLNSISLASNNKEEIEIESKIYDSLNSKEKIKVIIELKEDYSSKNLNEKLNSYNKRYDYLIDKLDNSIKKEGFKLIYHYENFNSLSAEVDKEGFEELKNSGLVSKLYDGERSIKIQLAESTKIINATEIWNTPSPLGGNITGKGQHICVIDTGVDYTHQALGSTYGNKVIRGYDFVNSDSDPMDDLGHGTHVAGIIAANGFSSNGTLLKGVAPDSKIIAVKVCDSQGTCLSTDILAGLNYCINQGKRSKKMAAISMSLADFSFYNSTTCPTWMNSAINSAVANKISVVASSGNWGWKIGIAHPACAPNVTSVGMTYDSNMGQIGWTIMPGLGYCWDNSTLDGITCASNSGPELDLVAPGVMITSTASSIGNPLVCGGGSPSGLGTCGGTSMSAPHVSGAIALIKERYQRNGTVQNLEVKTIEKILKKSRVRIKDPENNLTFPRLSLEHII